jgi:hypothetical protein
MMPPLLAPPTSLPNPPAGSDAGPAPKDDRQPASGSGDFVSLLATLGRARPRPAPAPAPEGSSDGPPAGPDGAEPPLSSFEAMVAALANQASGFSPGWAVPLPTSGGDASIPGPTSPVAGGTVTSPGSPAVGSSTAAGAAPWLGRAGTGADGAPGLHPDCPPAPDLVGPNGATGASAPQSRPAARSTARSAVADLAETVDGPGGRSAVAALAHSAGIDGSGSAMAALAHDDDHRAPGSPVTAEPGSVAAAFAHGDPGGPGSSESGAAPSDASGAPGPAPAAGDRQLRPRTSGRASAGGDQPTIPALGADPAWAGLESLSVPPVSASGDAPSAGPDRRAAGHTGAAPSGAHAVGPPSARPAEAVAAPAISAPAATQAAVADQIVSAVVPLHGRGDGRHEVTLELRPDDLGAIRVEVSVEHQTVHLTLHAADPATGRLLSAALPDLRSALADAGLTAGHVGVGTGGDGGTGAGAHRPSGEGDRPSGGPTRPGRSDASGPDTEPVRTIRPAAAGRLDLFL